MVRLAGIAASPDRREAVGRTRRDRAAATLVVPAQRDAVGMDHFVGWRIPEHVIQRLVDASHPAA